MRVRVHGIGSRKAHLRLMRGGGEGRALHESGLAIRQERGLGEGESLWEKFGLAGKERERDKSEYEIGLLEIDGARRSG